MAEKKLVEKILDEVTILKQKVGQVVTVMLIWRGKTITIKMFFPKPGMPTRSEVVNAVNKVYPNSNVIHFRMDRKDKGEAMLFVNTTD